MAADKIICDTDVIIDYWNVNNMRHINTKVIIESRIQINNAAIGMITRMELIIGAINKLELARINRNVLQFAIFAVDSATIQTAHQLLQTYNLSHGLGLPDSLIAATAIQNNYQLFTYNVKDYKFIKGLKLYQP